MLVASTRDKRRSDAYLTFTFFSVYHDLETTYHKTKINFYRKPPGINLVALLSRNTQFLLNIFLLKSIMNLLKYAQQQRLCTFTVTWRDNVALCCLATADIYDCKFVIIPTIGNVSQARLGFDIRNRIFSFCLFVLSVFDFCSVLIFFDFVFIFFPSRGVIFCFHFNSLFFVGFPF